MSEHPSEAINRDSFSGTQLGTPAGSSSVMSALEDAKGCERNLPVERNSYHSKQLLETKTDSDYLLLSSC